MGVVPGRESSATLWTLAATATLDREGRFLDADDAALEFVACIAGESRRGHLLGAVGLRFWGTAGPLGTTST